MTTGLPLGKLRGIQEIATQEGRLTITALDHRGSLRKAINPEDPAAVTFDDDGPPAAAVRWSSRGRRAPGPGARLSGSRLAADLVRSRRSDRALGARYNP